MNLNYSELSNGKLQTLGYSLPKYDIKAVCAATKSSPMWLHFGASNIFRMFVGGLQQTLLDAGLSDKGITAVECFDSEIPAALSKYDLLTVAVTLKSTGETQKTVLASLFECIVAAEDYARCVEVIKNDDLQLVSLTITEKGYAVADKEGNPLPYIATDLERFDAPSTAVGLLAKLLYERFKSGAKPLAVVSLDNCANNGDLLKAAVNFFAEYWVKNGKVENEFLAYLNGEKIAFNCSMIDKITPRPSPEVQTSLEADGFSDIAPIVTGKNTYVAAFVNAEESQYLAIEDNFPNGRPPLEKAGVIMCDRHTIEKIEKMKVGTCLNPLHTVLAVYGCLLGYESISGEMGDAELKAFVTNLAYKEAMPVVVNPGVINAKDFLNEVLTIRFPNPFVPDTPQRIACDTSQKVPVRFGETLKAYKEKGLDFASLTYIPLFIAGWLRYLLALDDNGEVFERSTDPMLAELDGYFTNIKFGDANSDISGIKPLLSRADIFGVDLYEVGLGEKVEGMFKEMITEKGAVRKVLKKYVING